MASYHCSAKIIGRSSGRSAVACSAYRSGESLQDEELGKKFDYTNKQGIEYSNIVLPENAPNEFQDRETLWNEVQKKEKLNNSQMAREFVFSVPHELNEEEGKKLADDIAKSFAKEGMCVDYAIHNPKNEQGETYNRHVHMMTTTRQLKENGEWASKERKAYKLDEDGNKIPVIDKKTGEQKIEKKTGRKVWERETVESNDWNTKEKLVEWRKRVADMTNDALEQAGQKERVTHLSFKDQGKEELPTIHEGYEARQIEKNGGISDRCEINREIKEYNNLLYLEKEVIKEKFEATKQVFTERKEQLHDRAELERSSGRMGETVQRANKENGDLEEFSRRGTENSQSLGESGERVGRAGESIRNSIADMSEKTAGVREQLQRERGTIEESKQGIRQRIGENVEGMRTRTWGAISDKLRTSLREKFQSIQQKIGELGEKYNSLVRNRATEEQPDKGLEKSSSKSVNTENRGDDTMSVMSRFNQIEAERKQKIAEKEAREKAGIKEDKPAGGSPEEKPSIMDKLNKWEKEKKENRTEPLKSEQKENEEQAIHRRPHHHR